MIRRLRLASVSPNVPLAVLDALSRVVLPMRAKGELLWWQLDNNIEQMLHLQARAERIKGTPVPLSYSRYTSRFLSVYTFTLPFALCSEERLALGLLPVTVAIISWVLFVTEEIGHIIEDPFGRGLNDNPDRPAPTQLEVLPLGRYCADIASDTATLFSSSPFGVDLADMPGGDEEVLLFDDPKAS